MFKMTPGWYVLYTRANHEKKIYQELSEMQIEAFLPTRKVVRNWSDRKQIIEQPLFPGYIFINLQNTNNYVQSLNTPGALYYLKTSNGLSRIHKDILAQIKIFVNDSRTVEIAEGKFNLGEQVVICEGSLAGLKCEVVNHNTQKKIIVRIELLNRNLLLALQEKELVSIKQF